MSVCKRCGNIRENDERCRVCNVNRQKVWSKENPDARRLSKLKTRERWLELFTMLGYVSCSKCGYDKCFAAIDFHHRTRGDKTKDVGTMIANNYNVDNITKVLEEIEKCDVLCANCHRELHYLKGGNKK